MELDPQSLFAQLDVNSPDRHAALRCLKNDIIGHVQKKEKWVPRGLLPVLVRLVESDAPELQALQLLASFAHGGAAFLPPLHASNILPAVLGNACLRNDDPQVVSTALQILRDITTTEIDGLNPPQASPASFADQIFTAEHLESFLHILCGRSPSAKSSTHVSLVASLIKALCREERHQSALVASGVLDALATKLASFAVAEGHVLPRAETLARAEGLADYIPEPTPPGFDLAEVLGAIAAIITDSPFRACKLLYSPSILAVFPTVDVDWTKYSRTPPESLRLPGLRPTKQKELGFMDLLLPQTAPQSNRHSYAAFPLGSAARESIQPGGRPSSKLQTSLVSWTPPEETIAPDSETEVEEVESPLVPWLIHLIRTRSGLEVLMAASVLTSLFKAGFTYKSRESAIGLLVIPILVDMLVDLGAKPASSERPSPGCKTAYHRIKEENPAILARLITDSEPLQKAAFDCNAVTLMSQLLKSTYDAPSHPAEARPWSPNGNDSGPAEDLPPQCRLGPHEQHAELTRRCLTMRENVLRALGALATFKEEYRKAIVEQDVIPYIIDSLSYDFAWRKQAAQRPRSANASNGISNGASPQQATNSKSVIIAACYTIRMLSRSVSCLRTALVDHGVSKPLFELLRDADIDVQIAATASICNLVPDFSPMRESLVDAGILKVLCEHAHSLNPSLRLNALWALKHLVDYSNIELKKRCVEELESGWLVQLICDDTEDDALFTSRAKGEKAAQNALYDLDEDMDMGSSFEQRPWLSTSFYKASAASGAPSNVRILREAEARLSALREAELNPIRKARHDDLAIQEQGLGFIRNLIGGARATHSESSTNDTTDMIDYIFTTLGQDRLFEILGSKLRVKVLHPFSRRGAAGGETRVLPPQAKIIEAVIYILVHVAASVPRHRQLVIAQTDLLRQLAKLFNSQDREVRVALCHLINNLTWQDDISDAPACSQRASELRKLGFLAKLETLGQSDEELDVRERAKSALWQMKH
ncbi:armadillo repeat protein [Xylariomycetidae sp. FL0641]|nr:armadillo repeat protein [Xylariomycetidae sp. FL0641]